MIREEPSLDLFTADLSPAEPLLTVGELAARLQSLIASSFPGPFWVAGEISNFRGKNAAGHCYFRLKDDRAVIEAVLWRGHQKGVPFALEEGLAVQAKGCLDLYPPHGKIQLIIEEMRPAGRGDLHRRFEELKKKLEGLGYFATQRKRPLPFIPERIALVTSPGGAVLRDIVQVVERRFPHLAIVLFPAKVQGEGAAQEIARAIRLAGQVAPACDLCLLARGGGSIEDLWAFNEEEVARAIFESPIPVVSAVGHQTDFTIADFVADLRAPTPSAAAELIVPDEAALRRELCAQGRQVAGQLRRVTQRYRGEYAALAGRPLFRFPQRLLDRSRQDLDRRLQQLLEGIENRFGQWRFDLNSRERGLLLSDPRSAWHARGQAFHGLTRSLFAAGRVALARQRVCLEEQQAALTHLNPLAVLSRGYSLTTDARGRVVRRAAQVAVGDTLAVRLAQGRLGVRVEKKREVEK